MEDSALTLDVEGLAAIDAELERKVAELSEGAEYVAGYAFDTYKPLETAAGLLGSEEGIAPTPRPPDLDAAWNETAGAIAAADEAVPDIVEPPSAPSDPLPEPGEPQPLPGFPLPF